MQSRAVPATVQSNVVWCDVDRRAVGCGEEWLDGFILQRG